MSSITFLLIAGFVYIAWVIGMAIGAAVIVVIMAGCILVDVVGRWIERRSQYVHFNEQIDDTGIFRWGTIRMPNPEQPVRFFRIRLPFSLVWDVSDYGQFRGWHERWLVWTDQDGWQVWHQRAHWA